MMRIQSPELLLFLTISTLSHNTSGAAPKFDAPKVDAASTVTQCTEIVLRFKESLLDSDIESRNRPQDVPKLEALLEKQAPCVR